MTNKVQFVHSDQGDWVGMYINGHLAAQGHSLAPEEVASALANSAQIQGVIQGSVMITSNTDWDASANGGQLPSNYSDVVFNGS